MEGLQKVYVLLFIWTIKKGGLPQKFFTGKISKPLGNKFKNVEYRKIGIFIGVDLKRG